MSNVSSVLQRRSENLENILKSKYSIDADENLGAWYGDRALGALNSSERIF